MFWILQALARFNDWLDWLLDTGERPFVVTLMAPGGAEWRVEVLAPCEQSAGLLVSEEYPNHYVLMVESLS